MNRKQKLVTGIAVTAIILIMLRKKIATALNTTAFSSISDSLFNVISSFEGFYAVPYWDRTGYSVGYGSQFNWDQNRPVAKTDVIDKSTAKNWLLQEAQQDFNFVQSKVRVPITDNQLLALSSFSYNVGRGAFESSTLLELLNNGTDINTVASQFDRWTKSGGLVNKGLIARRKAEKTLFLS
jgi:GH24 family phage-related lysozyme (muramidase)